MSIVIKVSTEKMSMTAQSVEKSLQNMRKTFESMETIINRTKTYWEGDGADSCRNAYRESKDSIETVIKRLGEEVSDLQNMAGIYSTAESSNQNVASALPDDVIS